LKFLICGLGSIGLRHLNNLQALGYHDVIVYSTGKTVVPGAIEKLNCMRVFGSIDAALKENPDVCMICNPTSLHVETALKAAKAGCHLFIEKPLSNSLVGLDEIKKIANVKNLTTLITYQFRFHPHINILKDIFSQKSPRYGKPLYVNAEWSEYLPDWHPWEDYKNGFSARRDLGGGVFFTQVHPINYLSYIFGPIISVRSNLSSTGVLGIDVDDVADKSIKFASGLMGHVHVDYLQKPRQHNMRVVTSSGRFEWDNHEHQLFFLDQSGNKAYFEAPNFERNDMFVEMLKHFIDCVKTNKKTRFAIEDAVTELKLLTTSIV
jgi:predicted dehydrogenase